MNLGGPELLIVIALVVLVFGAGWLPKAAQNLGKAKLEMDKAQQQFNEAKDNVVEQTGLKELEATIGKANKVMNSTPKNLMKDAAKSAVTGGGAAKAADAVTNEDGIEDAEIVEPNSTRAAAITSIDGEDDTNINVDFG